MLQSAWGSLFKSLRLQKGKLFDTCIFHAHTDASAIFPGDHLLIRGGTTSVGLAAASIAKHHGCTVSCTSRQASRSELLKSSGADHVFIDNGSIANDVRAKFPKGVDKVLELVGTTSLKDSLLCVNEVRSFYHPRTKHGKLRKPLCRVEFAA